MVHWHVTVYIMFAYCSSMKACMQKKKKKKINHILIGLVGWPTLNQSLKGKCSY